MLTKKRFQLRAIAGTLCLTFLAGELHAAPVEMFSKPALSEQILRSPETFEAPSAFSTLTEIHPGDKNVFIIHIQDAHSNFSGQDNLANTLDVLMKKYGVSLVLSEGGYGDCTLTPIKSIAKPEVWKRVARSFLMNGKIQGEEYLNLVSDHPMKIMGIEDAALYDKSLEAYRLLSEKREAVLANLEKIERAVEKLKYKLYPQELRAHENLRKDKAAFEKTFGSFFDLAAGSGFDLKLYGELSQLAALREKEKLINFEIANLEQAAMVEETHQKGGADDLDESLRQMEQMKGNKVALFTHFQNTLNIAKDKGIDIQKYENLLQYVEYLRGFSHLDFDKLLPEYEKAEDALYAKILQTDDAKILRSIDRFVDLLTTAHEIKMTADQYALLKFNEPDFRTESMEAFLNRKLAENGYFEDLIPAEPVLDEGRKALDAFYASVSERDLAFMRNVDSILKKENQKIAFLITGGYHTPHLKKLFQEKGFGYSVLTPLVSSETNQKKYEDMLLSRKSSSEKKVALTEGQAGPKDRSLADSDDLTKLMKKKDGLRALLALRELQRNPEGARLTELANAAGDKIWSGIDVEDLFIKKSDHALSQGSLQGAFGARLRSQTAGARLSGLSDLPGIKQLVVTHKLHFKPWDLGRSAKEVRRQYKKYITIFNATYLGIQLMSLPLIYFWWFKALEPARRDPEQAEIFMRQFEDPSWAGMLGYGLTSVSVFVAAMAIWKLVGAAIASRKSENWLIRDGVFSYTRNPLYLSYIGLISGLMLLSPLFHLEYLVPLIASSTFRSIRTETFTLWGYFGDDYLNYAKKTGAVIPKLTGLQKNSSGARLTASLADSKLRSARAADQARLSSEVLRSSEGAKQNAGGRLADVKVHFKEKTKIEFHGGGREYDSYAIYDGDKLLDDGLLNRLSADQLVSLIIRVSDELVNAQVVKAAEKELLDRDTENTEILKIQLSKVFDRLTTILPDLTGEDGLVLRPLVNYLYQNGYGPLQKMVNDFFFEMVLSLNTTLFYRLLGERRMGLERAMKSIENDRTILLDHEPIVEEIKNDLEQELLQNEKNIFVVRDNHAFLAEGDSPESTTRVSDFRNYLIMMHTHTRNAPFSIFDIAGTKERPASTGYMVRVTKGIYVYRNNGGKFEFTESKEGLSTTTELLKMQSSVHHIDAQKIAHDAEFSDYNNIRSDAGQYITAAVGNGARELTVTFKNGDKIEFFSWDVLKPTMTLSDIANTSGARLADMESLKQEVLGLLEDLPDEVKIKESGRSKNKAQKYPTGDFRKIKKEFILGPDSKNLIIQIDILIGLISRCLNWMVASDKVNADLLEKTIGSLEQIRKKLELDAEQAADTAKRPDNFDDTEARKAANDLIVALEDKDRPFFKTLRENIQSLRGDELLNDKTARTLRSAAEQLIKIVKTDGPFQQNSKEYLGTNPRSVLINTLSRGKVPKGTSRVDLVNILSGIRASIDLATVEIVHVGAVLKNFAEFEDVLLLIKQYSVSKGPTQFLPHREGEPWLIDFQKSVSGARTATIKESYRAAKVLKWPRRLRSIRDVIGWASEAAEGSKNYGELVEEVFYNHSKLFGQLSQDNIDSLIADNASIVSLPEGGPFLIFHYHDIYDRYSYGVLNLKQGKFLEGNLKVTGSLVVDGPLLAFVNNDRLQVYKIGEDALTMVPHLDDYLDAGGQKVSLAQQQVREISLVPDKPGHLQVKLAQGAPTLVLDFSRPKAGAPEKKGVAGETPAPILMRGPWVLPDGRSVYQDEYAGAAFIGFQRQGNSLVSRSGLTFDLNGSKNHGVMGVEFQSISLPNGKSLGHWGPVQFIEDAGTGKLIVIAEAQPGVIKKITVSSDGKISDDDLSQDIQDAEITLSSVKKARPDLIIDVPSGEGRHTLFADDSGEFVSLIKYGGRGRSYAPVNVFRMARLGEFKFVFFTPSGKQIIVDGSGQMDISVLEREAASKPVNTGSAVERETLDAAQRALKELMQDHFSQMSREEKSDFGELLMEHQILKARFAREILLTDVRSSGAAVLKFSNELREFRSRLNLRLRLDRHKELFETLNSIQEKIDRLIDQYGETNGEEVGDFFEVIQGLQEKSLEIVNAFSKALTNPDDEASQREVDEIDVKVIADLSGTMDDTSQKLMALLPTLKNGTPDYYGVLGIPIAATTAEVEKAARRAWRAHHPDVRGKEGEEMSKKIEEAKGVLADPDKRLAYDSSLFQGARMARQTSRRQFIQSAAIGSLAWIFMDHSSSFGGSLDEASGSVSRSRDDLPSVKQFMKILREYRMQVVWITKRSQWEALLKKEKQNAWTRGFPQSDLATGESRLYLYTKTSVIRPLEILAHETLHAAHARNQYLNRLSLDVNNGLVMELRRFENILAEHGDPKSLSSYRTMIDLLTYRSDSLSQIIHERLQGKLSKSQAEKMISQESSEARRFLRHELYQEQVELSEGTKTPVDQLLKWLKLKPLKKEPSLLFDMTRKDLESYLNKNPQKPEVVATEFFAYIYGRLIIGERDRRQTANTALTSFKKELNSHVDTLIRSLPQIPEAERFLAQHFLSQRVPLPSSMRGARAADSEFLGPEEINERLNKLYHSEGYEKIRFVIESKDTGSRVRHGSLVFLPRLGSGAISDDGSSITLHVNIDPKNSDLQFLEFLKQKGVIVASDNEYISDFTVEFGRIANLVLMEPAGPPKNAYIRDYFPGSLTPEDLERISSHNLWYSMGRILNLFFTPIVLGYTISVFFMEFTGNPVIFWAFVVLAVLGRILMANHRVVYWASFVEQWVKAQDEIHELGFFGWLDDLLRSDEIDFTPLRPLARAMAGFENALDRFQSDQQMGTVQWHVDSLKSASETWRRDHGRLPLWILRKSSLGILFEMLRKHPEETEDLRVELEHLFFNFEKSYSSRSIGLDRLGDTSARPTGAWLSGTKFGAGSSEFGKKAPDSERLTSNPATQPPTGARMAAGQNPGIPRRSFVAVAATGAAALVLSKPTAAALIPQDKFSLQRENLLSWEELIRHGLQGRDWEEGLNDAFQEALEIDRLWAEGMKAFTEKFGAVMRKYRELEKNPKASAAFRRQGEALIMALNRSLLIKRGWIMIPADGTWSGFEMAQLHAEKSLQVVYARGGREITETMPVYEVSVLDLRSGSLNRVFPVARFHEFGSALKQKPIFFNRPAFESYYHGLLDPENLKVLEMDGWKITDDKSRKDFHDALEKDVLTHELVHALTQLTASDEREHGDAELFAFLTALAKSRFRFTNLNEYSRGASGNSIKGWPEENWSDPRLLALMRSQYFYNYVAYRLAGGLYKLTGQSGDKELQSSLLHFEKDAADELWRRLTSLKAKEMDSVLRFILGPLERRYGVPSQWKIVETANPSISRATFFRRKDTLVGARLAENRPEDFNDEIAKDAAADIAALSGSNLFLALRSAVNFLKTKPTLDSKVRLEKLKVIRFAVDKLAAELNKRKAEAGYPGSDPVSILHHTLTSGAIPDVDLMSKLTKIKGNADLVGDALDKLDEYSSLVEEMSSSLILLKTILDLVKRYSKNKISTRFIQPHQEGQPWLIDFQKSVSGARVTQAPKEFLGVSELDYAESLLAREPAFGGIRNVLLSDMAVARGSSVPSERHASLLDAFYRLKTFADQIPQSSTGRSGSVFENTDLLEEVLWSLATNEVLQEANPVVEGILDAPLTNGQTLRGLESRLPAWALTNQENTAINSVMIGQQHPERRGDFNFLVLLYIAGRFHDIGKTNELIRAPGNGAGSGVSILDKPSRLTDKEFSVMKRHVPEGVKLLGQIPDGFFQEQGLDKITILDAVSGHHRYFDKGGYHPEGLAAADISILAHILAVADSADAMMTSRGYNRPKTPDETAQELQNGLHEYDPFAVRAMVELLQRRKVYHPALPVDARAVNFSSEQDGNILKQRGLETRQEAEGKLQQVRSLERLEGAIHQLIEKTAVPDFVFSKEDRDTITELKSALLNYDPLVGLRQVDPGRQLISFIQKNLKTPNAEIGIPRHNKIMANRDRRLIGHLAENGLISLDASEDRVFQNGKESLLASRPTEGNPAELLKGVRKQLVLQMDREYALEMGEGKYSFETYYGMGSEISQDTDEARLQAAFEARTAAKKAKLERELLGEETYGGFYEPKSFIDFLNMLLKKVGSLNIDTIRDDEILAVRDATEPENERRLYLKILLGVADFFDYPGFGQGSIENRNIDLTAIVLELDKALKPNASLSDPELFARDLKDALGFLRVNLKDERFMNDDYFNLKASEEDGYFLSIDLAGFYVNAVKKAIEALLKFQDWLEPDKGLKRELRVPIEPAEFSHLAFLLALQSEQAILAEASERITKLLAVLDSLDLEIPMVDGLLLGSMPGGDEFTAMIRGKGGKKIDFSSPEGQEKLKALARASEDEGLRARIAIADNRTESRSGRPAFTEDPILSEVVSRAAAMKADNRIKALKKDELETRIIEGSVGGVIFLERNKKGEYSKETFFYLDGNGKAQSLASGARVALEDPSLAWIFLSRRTETDHAAFKRIIEKIFNEEIQASTIIFRFLFEDGKAREGSLDPTWFLTRPETYNLVRITDSPSPVDLNLVKSIELQPVRPTAVVVAGLDATTLQKTLNFEYGATGTPFVLSNEYGLDELLRSMGALPGRGSGVYVGVSGLFNLSMIEVRRPSQAIIFDIRQENQRMWDLVEKTFEEAVDVRQFFKSLMEEFGYHPDLIIAEDRKILEESYRQLAATGVLDAAHAKEMAQVDWMLDNDKFLYLKQMFREQKILRLQLDIRDVEGFKMLGEWFRQNALRVDTIYSSNITQWFHSKKEDEQYLASIAQLADLDTYFVDSPLGVGPRILKMGDLPVLREAVLFALAEPTAETVRQMLKVIQDHRQKIKEALMNYKSSLTGASISPDSDIYENSLRQPILDAIHTAEENRGLNWLEQLLPMIDEELESESRALHDDDTQVLFVLRTIIKDRIELAGEAFKTKRSSSSAHPRIEARIALGDRGTQNTVIKGTPGFHPRIAAKSDIQRHGTKTGDQNGARVAEAKQILDAIQVVRNIVHDRADFNGNDLLTEDKLDRNARTMTERGLDSMLQQLLQAPGINASSQAILEKGFASLKQLKREDAQEAQTYVDWLISSLYLRVTAKDRDLIIQLGSSILSIGSARSFVNIMELVHLEWKAERPALGRDRNHVWIYLDKKDFKEFLFQELLIDPETRKEFYNALSDSLKWNASWTLFGARAAEDLAHMTGLPVFDKRVAENQTAKTLFSAFVQTLSAEEVTNLYFDATGSWKLYAVALSGILEKKYPDPRQSPVVATYPKDGDVEVVFLESNGSKYTELGRLALASQIAILNERSRGARAAETDSSPDIFWQFEGGRIWRDMGKIFIKPDKARSPASLDNALATARALRALGYPAVAERISKKRTTVEGVQHRREGAGFVKIGKKRIYFNDFESLVVLLGATKKAGARLSNQDDRAAMDPTFKRKMREFRRKATNRDGESGILKPTYDFLYQMVRDNLAQEIKPGHRVLEMGIGTGILTWVLADATRGVENIHYTGIDLNPAAVQEATKNLADFGNVKVLEGNLFQPLTDDEKFDFIFWNPPWYSTVQDPDNVDMAGEDPGYQTILRFLNEASGRLLPHGQLYLVFPVKKLSELAEKTPFGFVKQDSYTTSKGLEIALYQVVLSGARAADWSVIQDRVVPTDQESGAQSAGARIPTKDGSESEPEYTVNFDKAFFDPKVLNYSGPLLGELAENITSPFTAIQRNTAPSLTVKHLWEWVQNILDSTIEPRGTPSFHVQVFSKGQAPFKFAVVYDPQNNRFTLFFEVSSSNRNKHFKYLADLFTKKTFLVKALLYAIVHPGQWQRWKSEYAIDPESSSGVVIDPMVFNLLAGEISEGAFSSESDQLLSSLPPTASAPVKSAEQIEKERQVEEQARKRALREAREAKNPEFVQLREQIKKMRTELDKILEGKKWAGKYVLEHGGLRAECFLWIDAQQALLERLDSLGIETDIKQHSGNGRDLLKRAQKFLSEIDSKIAKDMLVKRRERENPALLGFKKTFDEQSKSFDREWERHGSAFWDERVGIHTRTKEWSDKYQTLFEIEDDQEAASAISKHIEEGEKLLQDVQAFLSQLTQNKKNALIEFRKKQYPECGTAHNYIMERNSLVQEAYGVLSIMGGRPEFRDTLEQLNVRTAAWQSAYETFLGTENEREALDAVNGLIRDANRLVPDMMSFYGEMVSQWFLDLTTMVPAETPKPSSTKSKLDIKLVGPSESLLKSPRHPISAQRVFSPKWERELNAKTLEELRDLVAGAVFQVKAVRGVVMTEKVAREMVQKANQARGKETMFVLTNEVEGEVESPLDLDTGLVTYKKITSSAEGSSISSQIEGAVGHTAHSHPFGDIQDNCRLMSSDDASLFSRHLERALRRDWVGVIMGGTQGENKDPGRWGLSAWIWPENRVDETSDLNDPGFRSLPFTVLDENGEPLSREALMRIGIMEIVNPRPYVGTDEKQESVRDIINLRLWYGSATHYLERAKTSEENAGEINENKQKLLDIGKELWKQSRFSEEGVILGARAAEIDLERYEAPPTARLHLAKWTSWSEEDPEVLEWLKHSPFSLEVWYQGDKVGSINGFRTKDSIVIEVIGIDVEDVRGIGAAAFRWLSQQAIEHSQVIYAETASPSLLRAMQKSGLAIRINDGEAFVRPGDADIRLNPYIASKAGSAMDVVAGQLSDLSRTGARVAGIEDLKNKVIELLGALPNEVIIKAIVGDKERRYQAGNLREIKKTSFRAISAISFASEIRVLISGIKQRIRLMSNQDQIELLENTIQHLEKIQEELTRDEEPQGARTAGQDLSLRVLLGNDRDELYAMGFPSWELEAALKHSLEIPGRMDIGFFSQPLAARQMGLLKAECKEMILKKDNYGDRNFLIYGVGLGRGTSSVKIHKEALETIEAFYQVLNETTANAKQWHVSFLGLDIDKEIVNSAADVFTNEQRLYRADGYDLSIQTINVNVLDENALKELSVVYGAGDVILHRNVTYANTWADKFILPLDRKSSVGNLESITSMVLGSFMHLRNLIPILGKKGTLYVTEAVDETSKALSIPGTEVLTKEGTTNWGLYSVHDSSAMTGISIKEFIDRQSVGSRIAENKRISSTNLIEFAQPTRMAARLRAEEFPISNGARLEVGAAPRSLANRNRTPSLFPLVVGRGKAGSKTFATGESEYSLVLGSARLSNTHVSSPAQVLSDADGLKLVVKGNRTAPHAFSAGKSYPFIFAMNVGVFALPEGTMMEFHASPAPFNVQIPQIYFDNVEQERLSDGLGSGVTPGMDKASVAVNPEADENERVVRAVARSARSISADPTVRYDKSRSVEFRLVMPEPMLEEDLSRLVRTVQNIAGGNVVASAGPSVEYFNDFPGKVNKEHAIVYVGSKSQEMLTAAARLSAGVAFTADDIKGEPMYQPLMVFMTYGARLPDVIPALVQMWNNLRSDLTVEYTPDVHKKISSVPQSASLTDYLNLRFKVLAMSWKESLVSAYRALTAVGEAA